MEYHFPIVIKVILGIFILWILYHGVRIGTLVYRGRDSYFSSTAFERHVTNPEYWILVAGDSTAVGIGAKKPEESTAGRLGTFYPHADIRNISKSGDRVVDTLAKLREAQVGSEKYNLLLIQVGANDITHQTPLDTLEKDLRDLIDVASEKSKQVVILHSADVGTAPIFPEPIAWFISRQSRIVHDLFVRVTAEKNVTYVDLLQAGTDDIFLQDIERYYAADHFHPSGEGYRVWFEEIQKVLNPLF